MPTLSGKSKTLFLLVLLAVIIFSVITVNHYSAVVENKFVQIDSLIQKVHSTSRTIDSIKVSSQVYNDQTYGLVQTITKERDEEALRKRISYLTNRLNEIYLEISQSEDLYYSLYNEFITELDAYILTIEELKKSGVQEENSQELKSLIKKRDLISEKLASDQYEYQEKFKKLETEIKVVTTELGQAKRDFQKKKIISIVSVLALNANRENDYLSKNVKYLEIEYEVDDTAKEEYYRDVSGKIRGPLYVVNIASHKENVLNPKKDNIDLLNPFTFRIKKNGRDTLLVPTSFRENRTLCKITITPDLGRSAIDSFTLFFTKP